MVFSPLDELPELAELASIVDDARGLIDSRLACEVMCSGRRFPVHVLTLGNPDPAVPAVGFFGGVHGLERIGAEVVIAYLRSLAMRLRWDTLLHRQLESMRLVFMPFINPGGAWRGTRANPNGVDLMRNAPIEASEKVPFLVGGQRISAGMPWFRGEAGEAMEVESQAVCRTVEAELLSRRFSIAVDCHSGFGVRDRIWFPYAHTRAPIAHLAEVAAFRDIFNQTHTNHRYLLEPQNHHYLTHGDLWDHLYRMTDELPGRVFLPFTLEMGSWLWIRKNPRQLFSRHGIFNPLIEHRRQRVLRRHLALLDFVALAAYSAEQWLPVGAARDAYQRSAHAEWYGEADRQPHA